MKKLGLNEIREKFLEFFESKEHLTVRSYPLIPEHDKTLLFIVAGMVPLKNYFSGLSIPPKTRMATVQKCIRTNDIDNVGHTARHASFFEMLGNFSFGDYFKKEAIAFAWDFSVKILGMPEDRIWASIYEEDDEAYEIWKNRIGMPENRIVRLGKEDNFWEIGTGTGPCGPCSELYFDRGEEFGCGCADCKPGCDCDRYLEYWNLVFTQFDKQADGSLVPLSKPNIDTGMGLERIACIMQNVNSIFEVDTFKAIIAEIEAISGVKYGADAAADVSFRIITDHIRAVTFITAEGVTPDNEGRGYVLRMLFRRAARHGKLLGIKENFMARLAATVADVFGESYSDLKERIEYIKSIVDEEENRFNKTLDSGLKILDGYIGELEASSSKALSGEKAFKLYDTYGFPLDLTLDILKDHGMSVDEEEFKKEMQEQKERARNARKDADKAWDVTQTQDIPQIATEFIGYDTTEADCKVLYIKEADDGICYVVPDRTPFYAASGGQVSDTGIVKSAGFEAEVISLQKLPAGQILHELRIIYGSLKAGDTVQFVVDRVRRFDIIKNHSATHLLHKALKSVLGATCNQAGSLVDADKIRFDFTHNKAMTQAEIEQVERIVNQMIFEQIQKTTEIMELDKAIERGAMALFGEKYSDIVRVVSFGNRSIELCGGVHVENTKDIGIFKIVSESAAAAGVRRIEALTGRAVYEYLSDIDKTYTELVDVLKTQKTLVKTKVIELIEDKKVLTGKIRELNAKDLSSKNAEIYGKAVEKNGIKVMWRKFDDADFDALRNLADELANRSEACIVTLLNVEDKKIKAVMKASKSAAEKGLNCGKLTKEIAPIIGGSGGGRPDMANFGGSDAGKIDEAYEKLLSLV